MHLPQNMRTTEPPKVGPVRAQNFEERLGAAVCGAIATFPFVIGVCGFAAHWNAYTNLTLILCSAVLWTTLTVALKHP